MNHVKAHEQRPRILIIPDEAIGDANGKDQEAEYRVRSNYARAVSNAGGLPLIIPHQHECMDAALRLADGILITGTLPGVLAQPGRLAFEEQLVTSALAQSVPVLGICHGMQLLGQCLGGRLLEEMPDTGNVRIDHNPRSVPDEAAHLITLAARSELNGGDTEVEIAVNSLHSHTLVGPGRFRVIARSPDGIIEAIAGESSAFCLGVQWHPEYQLTHLDRELMARFVAACSARSRARQRVQK